MRKLLAILSAAALVLPGCVEADSSLGEGLVDKSLLYDTYSIEFPLTEIQLRKAQDLSGYSSSRLTVGAIRDAKLGLTTREAAFTLIPAQDTIDLGENPSPVSFTLRFTRDTVSCSTESQKSIIQNLRVTELTGALPEADNSGCTQEIPHGSTLITQGIPVYDGGDELSFSFSTAYAQKYIDALRSIGPILKQRPKNDDEPESDLLDMYDDWVEALPGIHLAMDPPEGEGGRINLFNFSCMDVSGGYYIRNNNLAILRVHSTWNGVQKDSSFLFVPGEPALYDEVEFQGNNTRFDQYCFNRTTHTTAEGPAAAELLVEGGGGLKPVISALELQQKTAAAIAAEGRDPSKVIIAKATIVLPFEMPADYKELDCFPSILSPTLRMVNEGEDGKTFVSFAGLTDASVSTENQGDIDRSNLRYAPDITYHLQAIMARKDLDTATNADIWLLTINTEKTANATGSLYDNEYYQQLMYASYYNSIYGGGYGGYGGYGYGGYGYGGYGYNDYYSNYYNYMMLEQMMNASTQTSYTYSTALDKDRYYRAVLNGPDAASGVPVFRVTYAVPRG